MRHTSENLALELRKVTTEWGIKDKIILAVSDNAANIVSAIKSVGWKQLGCVAHTINLTVKDGLKNDDIQTIINKVKEIYQENQNKPVPLKLILEVSTRWNSTFYMLQRFIELEEAIKSTVAILEKELPILTAGEWKTIKELCKILRPFEDATKTISGEKYCTASLVIPICNGIRKTLLNLSKNQFSELIKNILEILRSTFEERLGNVENSNTLSISTFLCPKFKQMGFSNDTTANSVKQKIINMIAAKITIKTKEDQEKMTTSKAVTADNADTKNIDDGNDEEEISIWSDFDKKFAANQPKGSSTSRAIIEKQRYMEEDIIPRDSDSFLWWQQHKQILPHLSQVAQERLLKFSNEEH
ncbi:hypothetical protein NQ314_002096 [Rhamnusium bicolor]|uniref:Uncharacterized protein n=1 Tax=Rhamnusium bicolor TaxID=1586634 RepID=A0AAV8ZT33_9CUCU|nr:hypothetical protein NQ314_002096 [Rhamnusium bicolor]